MPKLIRELKNAVHNILLDNLLFRRNVRERLCRQEFFYDAFRALSFNRIDGDYAEFGCHTGTTFSLAYHESRRHRLNIKFWAFDSFEGLPPGTDPKDEHPRWRAGSRMTGLDQFHEICRANGIPKETYECIAGYYEESLAKRSKADSPLNIALAYIDCDLYSSTKTVLEFLKPRLKHGMIVAFDDYFAWSPTRMSGNRRAMLEIFAEDPLWRLLPYKQFGWHGLAFVVEPKSLEADDARIFRRDQAAGGHPPEEDICDIAGLSSR